MAIMNVSLPDPMRERRLKELDASIEESLREMKAGGGHDLDDACDAIIAERHVMPSISETNPTEVASKGSLGR